MVWYYAEGERQRGPISDEEFQELVNKGRIHHETLIWQDGMETWQPMKEVWKGGPTNVGPSVPVSSGPNTHDASPELPGMPTPPQGLSNPATPPAPSQSASNLYCAQCRRGPLAAGDGSQLGNLRLCRQCDADMARHYQQQTWQQQGNATPAGGWAGQAYSHVAGAALVFASIFSRAVAKILDNLLATIVMVILMVATADVSQMGFTMDDLANDPEKVFAVLAPYMLASVIFAALYDAILVGFFGATLGKMALGIRIVSGDGSRVKWSQAIIRAIAPAILQLPGALIPTSGWATLAQFIFICGYLIAVADPQRRTLYDHLANTRVVQ